MDQSVRFDTRHWAISPSTAMSQEPLRGAEAAFERRGPLEALV